jgi:hypothetical protein
MVVPRIRRMRNKRVFAFERAVILLLSLPAGCGSRTISPSAASDAATPIRGFEPGQDLIDAATPVVEPGQGLNDAAAPTYVVDAAAPVGLIFAPTFVAEAGACAWARSPTNLISNPTGGACTWVADFKGDPVACVGFLVGGGTPAQCLAICRAGVAEARAPYPPTARAKPRRAASLR